jgi:hypothetical protein
MGAPTKYKPEMCDKVINLMAQGWAITELCYAEGGLGIHYTTLQAWREKYPEFDKAVRDGIKASEAHWTGIGHKAALGQMDGFNATAWIFNMKNRFQWADKQEIKQDHTSSDGSMSPTRIELVAPKGEDSTD